MYKDPDAIFVCLFIDPGSTKSGWALVEVYRNGTMKLRQGGWRSMADIAWLGGLMDEVWDIGGVVCMEYIDGGLYDRCRWQNLGETMRVEGDIRTTARHRGAEHVMLPFSQMPTRRQSHPKTMFCVPATSVRQELCNDGKASDEEIEVVVASFLGSEASTPFGPRVMNHPWLDSDSKVHVVDASAGCIVMASVFLKIPLRIPNNVRAAQAKAKAAVRQKKAIRKKLERLGVGADRAFMADGTPITKVLKSKSSRGVRNARRVKAANTRGMKR